MDNALCFFNRCNTVLWGLPTLLLLVGVGLFFTFRLRFFQIRRLRLWLSGTVGTLFGKGKPAGKGVSPFQSAATALAATVGVGNIVGVSGAIALGGPGAVFWMWVSALFGMMTKYAEVLLAVKYRRTDRDGRPMGGAMWYLRDGLKSPLLAVVYAALAFLSSLGIGNLVQCNSAARALTEVFPAIPAWAVALALAAAVTVVTAFGVGGIAKTTEKLVPFMSVLYVLLCAGILYLYRDQLPTSLRSIFTGAFSLRAAGCGAGGYGMMAAMRYGIGRGVFSNEVGLGTSAFAHAASRETVPARQAMWGVFEVFVDTLLMCTLTALVLLCACSPIELTLLDGVTLPLYAFCRAYGNSGRVFVAIFVLLFAFSTVIAWYYYGACALSYLFPKRKNAAYRVVFPLVIVAGCLFRSELVWSIADTANGLLLLPNLTGLLLLSGEVAADTRKFLAATPLRRRQR